tara:strand:- start:13192 stop:14175 length:984 start_codon:yes stop_codon:yes gene_type:complete
MPTIRKRKSRWQAQVRVKDKPALTKTFDRYQDAVSWAAQIEKDLRGRQVNTGSLSPSRTTLGDLIERYKREITPAKRSATIEELRLGKMALDRIARKTLGSITTSDAADYRDRRLALVSVDTVRRDLGTLQHVWDVAERSWGLVGAENPFRLILKPKPGPGRTRRLSEDEELRLEVACNACRNKVIPLVVTFALETAMRQGEIVGLQKADIDYEKRLALVRISKNGRSRLVPLSERALEAARCAADLSDDTRVFATTTTGVKMAWKRILRRSAIDDLHFHDLRHEAISRLFERGLSLPEVALVSGHRTPAMLMRYTHIEAGRIAMKL